MSTALNAQISSAIGAHGLWKARLAKAIQSGHLEHDPSHVEVDNRCEFGQWLHETIDACDKAAPDYRQVKDLHARFHKEAARILRLVSAGRTADAESALGSEYAKISTELVQLLKDWKAK